MPDMLKAPLLLVAFGLLSVVVTAIAAGLALHRPAVSHLTLETRSRLVADYSSDPLAQRLEPLSPAVIKAAADDEAELAPAVQITEEPSPPAGPAQIPTSTATAVGSPRATATPTPRFPTSPTPANSTPQPTSTRAAARTSTPGPSPTATVFKPTATFTPQPTFTPTPKPTETPKATATPPNTPQPTYTPKPATPQPTATPKNNLYLCDRIDPPPPIGLCDLLP